MDMIAHYYKSSQFVEPIDSTASKRVHHQISNLGDASRIWAQPGSCPDIDPSKQKPCPPTPCRAEDTIGHEILQTGSTSQTPRRSPDKYGAIAVAIIEWALVKSECLTEVDSLKPKSGKLKFAAAR
jgi:hypothetical protein